MPKRRGGSTTAGGPNKPLALFATFLVVVGIVAVALVSSMKTGSPGSTTSVLSASSTVAMTSSTAAIALVNDSAVTLLHFDGTSERLKPQQFTQAYGAGPLPVEGVQVANGSEAYFHAPGETVGGIPSPNGQYLAHLESAKSDGAGVIQVSKDGETPQSVVLRSGRTALTDPFVQGWFDDDMMIVTAHATSTRWVYAVSRTGTIEPIVTLPDNVTFLAGRGGMLWYATATLGEGLESPPTGPSEIHRVTLRPAQDVRVADDATHAINMVVPGTDGWFAYTTDDGRSYVERVDGSGAMQGERISLGSERPLLFLSADRLVLRDNFSLVLKDLRTGQVTTLGALPEGQVDAFYLDASSSTP